MSRSAVEHPLVTAYLDTLRQRAAPLTESRRVELVEEIQAHIEGSLPESPSDAEIRNMLDRLGTPEEILDAELDDPHASWEPQAPEDLRMASKMVPAVREPLATGDAVGLVLLLVGGLVLFPVGYMVGTALIGASRRWSVLARVLLVALPCVVALMVAAFLVLESKWYSPADLIGDPLGTLRGWLETGLAALPYTSTQVAALIAVWFLSRRTQDATPR